MSPDLTWPQSLKNNCPQHRVIHHETMTCCCKWPQEVTDTVTASLRSVLTGLTAQAVILSYSESEFLSLTIFLIINPLKVRKQCQ